MIYYRRTSLVARMLYILPLIYAVAYVDDASAQNRCEALCQRPDVTSQTVVIDANTGRILEGATRLRDAEDVRLVFANKNPFKYDYRFQVNAVSLDRAIPMAFLSRIGGFPSLTDEVVNPGAESCDMSSVEADINNILSTYISPYNENLSDIREEVEELGELPEAYNDFMELTNTDDLSVNEICEVCEQAAELLPLLESLSQVEALASQLDEVQRLIAEAATELDQVNSELQTKTDEDDYDDNCQDWVTTLINNVGEAEAAAQEYEETVETLIEVEEEVAPMRRRIRQVLASDTPFHEVRYAPDTGGAAEITVNLYRTNLRAPDEGEQLVNTVTVEAGRSHFSLSGGISVSTIDEVEIVRRSGLILVPGDSTRADTTVVGNVFDYAEESGFRPAPVLLLSGHLNHWPLPSWSPVGREVSLGLTSGIVLEGEDDALDVEYLLGCSFGFLDNDLLLTVALHVDQEERLGEGFSIGSAVPSDLPDPLPTTKEWKTGLAVAISYKIR